MNNKLLFLLLLSLPLMLGWSPSGRSQESATATPVPRLDVALVYVYRVGIGEEVRVGSVRIAVDGKAVFGVKNYGYSWFYLPAGTHEFKADWSFMEKPRFEEGHFGPSVITLETQPGMTYYINYLINQSEEGKSAKGFAGSLGLIGKASSKSHVIFDGLVIEGDALGRQNLSQCHFQVNHFAEK